MKYECLPGDYRGGLPEGLPGDLPGGLPGGLPRGMNGGLFWRFALEVYSGDLL